MGSGVSRHIETPPLYDEGVTSVGGAPRGILKHPLLVSEETNAGPHLSTPPSKVSEWSGSHSAVQTIPYHATCAHSCKDHSVHTSHDADAIRHTHPNHSGPHTSLHGAQKDPAPMTAPVRIRNVHGCGGGRFKHGYPAHLQPGDELTPMLFRHDWRGAEVMETCAGEVLCCYRITSADHRQWRFYNDTVLHEMEVSHLFDPAAGVVALGQTALHVRPDARVEARLLVRPGETGDFVSGLLARGGAERARLRRVGRTNRRAVSRPAAVDGAPFRDGDFPAACWAGGWAVPPAAACWRRRPAPAGVGGSALGGQGVVAALAIVAEEGGRVQKLFRHPRGAATAEAEERVGATRVALCRGSWWAPVLVDHYLPVLEGRLVGGKSVDDSSELWVALAEKAMAKTRGGYECLADVDALHALRDFTGYPTSRFDACMDDPTQYEALFDKLCRFVELGFLVLLDKPRATEGDANMERLALRSRDAYLILDMKLFQPRPAHDTRSCSPGGGRHKKKNAPGTASPATDGLGRVNTTPTPPLTTPLTTPPTPPLTTTTTTIAAGSMAAEWGDPHVTSPPNRQPAHEDQIHRLVRFRNTFGCSSDWLGDWGLSDRAWATYPAIAAACKQEYREDGTIWMDWHDVIRCFSGCGVCFVHDSFYEYRVEGKFTKSVPNSVVKFEVPRRTFLLAALCQNVSEDRPLSSITLQLSHRVAPSEASGGQEKRTNHYPHTGVDDWEALPHEHTQSEAQKWFHKSPSHHAEHAVVKQQEVILHATGDCDAPSRTPGAFHQAEQLGMICELRPEHNPYYLIPRIDTSHSTGYVLSFYTSIPCAATHRGSERRDSKKKVNPTTRRKHSTSTNNTTSSSPAESISGSDETAEGTPQREEREETTVKASFVRLSGKTAVFRESVRFEVRTERPVMRRYQVVRSPDTPMAFPATFVDNCVE